MVKSRVSRSLEWQFFQFLFLHPVMNSKEMEHLTDCLFSCKSPLKTSKGLSIVKEINQEEIIKKFN